MQQPAEAKAAKPTGPLAWLATNIFRILISLFVPIVTFVVLYAGFVFLRDSNAPKLIVAIVAVIWGVGGVALLYLCLTGWSNDSATRGAPVSCRLSSLDRLWPS